MSFTGLICFYWNTGKVELKDQDILISIVNLTFSSKSEKSENKAP